MRNGSAHSSVPSTPPFTDGDHPRRTLPQGVYMHVHIIGSLTRRTPLGLSLVLSESRGRKELAIIGPNWCGHANFLNKCVEYSPHGASPKYSPEHNSACGPLRNAEDELDDVDRTTYRSAARTPPYHEEDRPDIQFTTDRCMARRACPDIDHRAR